MSAEHQKYTNHLIHEKSPYLLQHAHNPVDWYTWGPAAFKKAKKENKPIFLSIGYSTCHWCHVMEHESFENERIAKIMNENFVNIKVDREERPDVDQIYMSAVQIMTGSGGWPLSAFLNHELKPFFGGTYFPPDRRWGRPGFEEVLLELSRLWKEDSIKNQKAAYDIVSYLSQKNTNHSDGTLSFETIQKAFSILSTTFDAHHGGFGPAPKFPHSETLSLLLRFHRRTGEKRALEMTQKTLDSMARGGIYDHIGGGFHRYATDAQWLVPHFEKMLYDNALLAKTYLEAYLVDKNEMWAGVARETLDYILRDMTSPEGGFYSAEDADSEGVEGKFYVWSSEGESQKLMSSAGFINTPFEGGNILHMNASAPWQVRSQEPLSSTIQKLRAERQQRIHPYKDDKILASWNGLMISAMAFGAQVLGEEQYLKSAQAAADFILKTLWNGQSLKRRYREGDVRFEGALDDYSFVIQGLLDLYETDFDIRWYQAAQKLQKKSDELFWDTQEGGYFFSDSGDSTLLIRTKEIYDGAVPSGNSVAALNLLRFYAYTLDNSYQKKAEQLFKHFGGFVAEHPQASPGLLLAVDFQTDQAKEIVIAGKKEDPKVQSFLKELRNRFIPNKVIGLADSSPLSKTIPLLKDKTPLKEEATLYVCQGHQCQQPTVNFKDAEFLLR